MAQSNSFKSLPLSLFEIHTYLVPGGTLLFSCFFIERFAVSKGGKETLITPLYFILKEMEKVLGENQTTAKALLALIVLFGFCYLLGHIIAAFSHVVMQEIFVEGGHKNIRDLLYAQNHVPEGETVGLKTWKRIVATRIGLVQGLFFWLNAYLMLRFIMLAHNQLPKGLGAWLFKPTESLMSLMGYWLVILFALLVFIGSRAFRKALVEDTTEPNIIEKGFSILESCWLISWIARFASFPYVLITTQFAHQMSCPKFSNTFSEEFSKQFYRHFGEMPEDLGNDTQALVQMVVTQQLPAEAQSMATSMRMYVFSRNLSTACFFGFLYGLIWQLIHPSNTIENSLFPMLPIALFIAAHMLAMRFFHYYTNVYHREIFQAYYFASTQEKTLLVKPPTYILQKDGTQT